MDERLTLEALHSFASIARELAAHPDRADTSSRIVQLAVKVVGCDAAVVARLVRGKLIFQAGTDPELTATIHAIALDTGQSISLQAYRERDTVLRNDLENEFRWGQASRRWVDETPVRAVLAFHLQLESQDLGALTLYSNTAGYTPPRCVRWPGCSPITRRSR